MKVQFVLVTSELCPFCLLAEEDLREAGLRFKEIDVNELGEKSLEYVGSVPTLVVELYKEGEDKPSFYFKLTGLSEIRAFIEFAKMFYKFRANKSVST